MEQFRGTTIVSVRRNGKVAIAGDGQVSMGNTIMKGNARKVRRLAGGRVIAGFAGGTADAFTLFELFESKLEQYGNLTRAAIELAKDWRTDRRLRRLEALLCVADSRKLLRRFRKRRRDRARRRPDGDRLRRSVRTGCRDGAAAEHGSRGARHRRKSVSVSPVIFAFSPTRTSLSKSCRRAPAEAVLPGNLQSRITTYPRKQLSVAIAITERTRENGAPPARKNPCRK